MLIIKSLVSVFAVLIAFYAAVLYRDVFLHREEFKAEKGNVFALAFLTAGIQFLATMGISDFNISIPVYPDRDQDSF